jgi:hypothetical protein
MSRAVIDCPHWVPEAAAISRIRLLPASAMYRSPAESRDIISGWSKVAAVARPWSPLLPGLPVTLPAMV